MVIAYQLRAAYILILFLIINIGYASFIEGSVFPHKGNRNTDIMISYSVDSSVKGKNPRVKVYLSNYIPETNSFNTSTSHILVDYFSINPDNISPIHLKLINKPSNFYKICLGLRYDGYSSTRTDCDKDNQFLLVDDTPIQQNIIKTEPSDLLLSAVIPKNVFDCEKFFINVSLYNEGGSKDINVYSYVYNGSQKVSEGSWNGNSVYVSLSGRSNTSVLLSNKVCKVGDFIIAVRVNYGKKLSIKKGIKVIKKPFGKLSLGTLLVNKTLRIIVSNPDYYFHNASLLFFSKNGLIRKDFTLMPKHSKEWYFNILPGVNTILLFNKSTIIYNKTFFINKTKINKTIIKPLKFSPIVKKISKKSSNKNLETLLYSIIVVVSLSSFIMVFKR